MIESSDLNDGDILQQTTQRNDGQGNIQFVITLPSGRVLTSEWISPDNRRQAVHAWLDVVKAQAVGDSEAEEQERNARLRRKASETQQVDESVASVLFGGNVSRTVDEPRNAEPPKREKAAVPSKPSAVAGVAPVSSSSLGASDAMDYVQQRLQAARAESLRAAREEKRWGIILTELEKT